MTLLGRLHIDALQMGNGDYLVYGTDEEGKKIGSDRLMTALFAWHAESFYGTALEWRREGEAFGFVLPLRQAIGYWADPAVLLHASVAWSDRIESFRRLSAILGKAVARGWYFPSFERNGQDNPVICWKLLRGGPEHPDPDFASECGQAGWTELDRQLDLYLRAIIGSPGEAGAAWSRLVQVYPEAEPLAGRQLSVKGCEDEQEYWERIGYRTDTLPFQVGLRLEEPDEEEAPWRLQPILVDRERPHILHACTPEGKPLDGDQPPAEWLSAAPDAVKRQEARWRKWMGIDGFAWEMDGEQAFSFLEKGSRRLTDKGVAVYLPRWWEELLKQRPRVVSQLRVAAAPSGLLGPEQLLAFDWKVAIGDSELTESEFREALRTNKSLVRIHRRWVPLRDGWVKALQRFLQRRGKLGELRLAEVLEMFLTGGRDEEAGTAAGAPDRDAGGGSGDLGGSLAEPASGLKDPEPEPAVRWEVRLNAQTEQLLDQLHSQELRPALAAPSSLGSVLRPYQTDGLRWLLFLRRIGFGGCLADDMGLGKTLQFIAYLLYLKESGELVSPGLLICPTSVLGNWQKEIERFAPALRAHLHYGPGRAKGEAFQELLPGTDLIITSYSLAQLDEQELSSRVWSVIGLDEAQNIKNPHGKQSVAIRNLQAEHRIALTGTPVENRLNELWTIFDFINPGYLGTLGGFQKRYAAPIEKSEDAETSERLQRLVRPFLLRRMKNDSAIQLNLPEKNESRVYVPLTTEQGTLYENALGEMLEQLDRLSPMERRGVILATLGKLKQICDHPALYLKEALVTGDTGGMKSVKSFESWLGRSLKLQRLNEMVGELLEEKQKCLIFTQYVEMGRMLQTAVERVHGERADFLHGGVSKEERDRMVERFQRNGTPGSGGDSHSVLVLSLKAGGTGLNLTAANHVFHYDRWWNPAVEEQATDRAYRIGQTREVQVHKFVSLGTLEERIDEMIERKKRLSSQIVGAGENWITELSTGELRDLFALRREWVRD
ncbi:DEAD/DEAH box helicase [uncultured Paenibacillus sp.]|uniref:DEAD/DEAH box helicase n=1 Tax=uncultured Paenibacillus sp. TaxID=227322 RepID=UPI0028D2CA2A|nr:DEAD/DEAH box helicase [uncultured Paenibacillus sp.]